MKGHFKHTCPNCDAKDKVITRCRTCYALICSDCTKYDLCTDCYTLTKDKAEVDIYFKEKYKNREDIISKILIEALPNAM